MSTVKKFTFDLDFDAPEEPEVVEEEVEEEPEVVVPTFSEEEMAAERSEGFVEGLEQGRKEAADATEQRLLEVIEKTFDTLENIYSHQAEANHEIAAEMISISTAIAKKMFPDLNARNALGEVERVVQETLKAITEEPRVQIIVSPELRELLSERISTMTHRAGFEGKVFVNPDPSLKLGDCRVEWSNGAAIRNADELWEMIDEIIERNLHGAPDIDDESEEAQATDADSHDTDPSSDQTADTSDRDDTQDEAVNDTHENASEAPQSDQQNDSQPEAQTAQEPEAEDMPDVDIEQAQAPEPEPETTYEETSEDDLASEVSEWPEAESKGPDQQAFDDAAPEAPIEEETSELNDDQDEETHEPEDPSFTPSIPFAQSTPEPDNSVSDQPLDDATDEAPIPHIDDEISPETNETPENSGQEDTEEAVRDFDPVSPATTAAILEAQSDLNNDDDEPNPSGG